MSSPQALDQPTWPADLGPNLPRVDGRVQPAEDAGARARSVAEDIFPKLVEQKGELPVIKDQLPTIFHHKDVPPGEIQQALVVWARARAVACLARAVKEGTLEAVSEEES